jgi:hypothetical protein
MRLTRRRVRSLTHKMARFTAFDTAAVRLCTAVSIEFSLRTRDQLELNEVL